MDGYVVFVDVSINVRIIMLSYLNNDIFYTD